MNILCSNSVLLFFLKDFFFLLSSVIKINTSFFSFLFIQNSACTLINIEQSLLLRHVQSVLFFIPLLLLCFCCACHAPTPITILITHTKEIFLLVFVFCFLSLVISSMHIYIYIHMHTWFVSFCLVISKYIH